MNYNEARALLEAGKKVRLPEWTGFWYLDAQTQQTMAFTRTGERAPAWDAAKFPAGFEHRTDWEEVTKGLGYDFAVLALKSGKLVRREGWNGKGMFVFMRPGDVLNEDIFMRAKSIPDAVKQYFQKQLDSGAIPFLEVEFTPYLCMKAADGSIVNGWLASQTDMLSNDWEIVE